MSRNFNFTNRWKSSDAVCIAAKKVVVYHKISSNEDGSDNNLKKDDVLTYDICNKGDYIERVIINVKESFGNDASALVGFGKDNNIGLGSVTVDLSTEGVKVYELSDPILYDTDGKVDVVLIDGNAEYTTGLVDIIIPTICSETYTAKPN